MQDTPQEINDGVDAKDPFDSSSIPQELQHYFSKKDLDKVKKEIEEIIGYTPSPKKIKKAKSSQIHTENGGTNTNWPSRTSSSKSIGIEGVSELSSPIKPVSQIEGSNAYKNTHYIYSSNGAPDIGQYSVNSKMRTPKKSSLPRRLSSLRSASKTKEVSIKRVTEYEAFKIGLTKGKLIERMRRAKESKQILKEDQQNIKRAVSDPTYDKTRLRQRTVESRAACPYYECDPIGSDSSDSDFVL